MRQHSEHVHEVLSAEYQKVRFSIRAGILIAVCHTNDNKAHVITVMSENQGDRELLIYKAEDVASGNTWEFYREYVEQEKIAMTDVLKNLNVEHLTLDKVLGIAKDEGYKYAMYEGVLYSVEISYESEVSPLLFY